MNTIRMSLFVILSLPAWAAHSQVYKCVDPATGKVAYLQSPCPASTRAEAVWKAVPSAPATVQAPALGGEGAAAKTAAAKSSGPKTAAELEQDYRKRRQEQDDVRKKEDEKLAAGKAKEDNCRSARQQLVSLESGVRQARVNDKGERYFLEDAQVEQEKAQARKSVEQSCK
jgi:hypothetical protein